MKFVKLFGAALVAACAIVAVVAASAFALPTILPEGAQNWTGAATSRTKLARQGGLAAVECGRAKGEGNTQAGKPLGEYHITFEECAAAGGACTGLSDRAGTILALGEWHLVFDTLKAQLSEAGVAILFLVNEVHLECNIPLLGKQLETVFSGGMVLCLVENPTALTKTFEFKCKEKGTNKPELTKYYNNAGALVNITALKSSENEGTQAEAVQVGNWTVTYENAVLLML
jgi:hypothetical protein